MQPSETFSSPKLREHMVIRGLDMKAMARLSGLHVTTIQQALARGRCELETLKRIAAVLDEVPPIVGIVAIRRGRREMPTNVDATLSDNDKIAAYHRARASKKQVT